MSEVVLMPKELTAENGAKALLIGEFHVETQVPNPDYDEFLDDEDEEPQFFTQQIPVPWDTIKKIYAKAVEHLAKPVVKPTDEGRGLKSFGESMANYQAENLRQ
jgi:hypothetical protein